MRSLGRGVFVFLPAFLAFSLALPAQDIDFRGQVSGWLTIPLESGRGIPVGVRYLPVFSLKTPLSTAWNFDVEAAANIFSTVDAKSGWDSLKSDAKIYRLWARLTTDRFEARLGLQKIEFGSARLLRPLMWFDRVDPNDPLQLTDGVTGLLLKYTFQNNASVWAWGLTGNNARKGWESFPTRAETIEFGGRAQIPGLGGELGLTFHNRRLDAFNGLIPMAVNERESVPETRIGLDGYWDVGPGIWFEAVFTRQNFSVSPFRFQKAFNAGLENTFALGNGLTVLAEHLVFQSSPDFWKAGTNRSLSALSLDYPLGLMDHARLMVFRDWTGRDWYRLATWQRAYDRVSIFVIAFWNPPTYGLYGGSAGANLFGGRGIYFMVAWNH
ncbi:MAG: hypothetical protein ACYDH3_03535 [Candidatus Aminicenantales bacterium]